MCQRVQLTLQCHPASVAAGRHWVAQTLLGWATSDADTAHDLIDDLVLVTSELLANAVAACTERVVVGLEAHRDRIRVTIRDDSPEQALAREASEGATGGRGLTIVDSLSERWGQSAYDGFNKDVWAEVRVGPGSVLAQCPGC